MKKPDQPYGDSDITGKSVLESGNKARFDVSAFQWLSVFPDRVLTFHVESSDPSIGQDKSIADLLFDDD